MKISRHTVFILFFIFGNLFTSFPLVAGTTGKIAGIVSTADGEPLAGANIIITAQIVNDKEIPLSSAIGAAADINGDFFILNIRPGYYVVECSMIGFQTKIIKPLYVAVDRTSSINFILEEQIMETNAVVVIAERAMVVKDLTSASAKVSGETIDALPVESFEEVLSLQSGITTGISGGIHIRGGRSSEIKYYVDGIAVSNPFNNNLAVPVENNAIQELEVISGTFNAEYGQAQSGIVNIVTKEGTEKFTGTFSAYTGDFVSNRNEVFWNIDDFDPFSQKYVEGSISGPLLTPKLKYFTSLRYTKHDNWLYGKRVFMPIDSSSFAATNQDDWYIEATGDSQFVSMNPSQSISGVFKLTYQLTSTLKIAYNLLANTNENRQFSAAYRLNPESQRDKFSESYNNMLNISHTLTPSMFYTLKFAFYENDYKSYVHEDPSHPEYRALFGRGRQPDKVFLTGGIDGGHYFKRSRTYAIRADYNVQLDKFNLVKIGAEYRTHDLYDESYQISVDPNVYGDWESRIQPLTSILHNRYKHKPIEFAAFIQDKIEIEDLIVNAGLRFDYFDPQSTIPVDLRDPANKLFPVPEAEAYEDVKPKTQVSPRLGLAFPITAEGVVHAAYGQFFQIPEFDRLYENPEFEVAGSVSSFIGNADLQAQRTDMYELGLQQQLADFIAVDITGYYRNIRNLMGSKIYETYRGDILYGRYQNNSHGSVRGLTIAAKIRVPQHGLTADLNYTYQSAKGIASDPKQEFFDAQGRNESTIVLNPLAWDLPHSFNAFFNYVQNDWGSSIIFKLNSGYPFTPGGYTELRNAGRYQGDFFVDLSAYKRFDVITGMQVEIFAKINNLFDSYRIDLLPEIRPVDEEAHRNNGFDRFNTIYDYSQDPEIQPRPREIRIGTKVIF